MNRTGLTQKIKYSISYVTHTLLYVCTDQYSPCAPRLTEMQEDLSLIPLHVELVFIEKFLVLLLFDLCHNVLSFL